MRERHKLDAYYTASQLTYALVDNVLAQIGDTNDFILEPCAGKNAITNALRDKGYGAIITADIDESLVGIDKDVLYHLDATEYNEFFNGFDWVITNPPYTQPDCQKIIENSMRYARKGICMLLRLSYDEPCKERAEFLKNTVMSHQIIFNPRPRFRTDTKGSDNVTTCWFVWLTNSYAAKCAVQNTEKIYVTGWNKRNG